MRRKTVILALVLSAGMTLPVQAADFCATPEQAEQVAAFYAANPGTMPPIAAARLQLAEATVVSALDAAHAASAAGSHFAEVWVAIGSWKEATFLIMKGDNVFEIRSAAGRGAPSASSRYFNIEYTQPLRGHLRPDQYASIYAVVLPREGRTTVRGVVFYDADGRSVFGAYLSGEGPEPDAVELAKFDELLRLLRSKPAPCARD